MEPTRSKFKHFKKRISNLKLGIGIVPTDVSQWHEPPLPEPLIQGVEMTVDQHGNHIDGFYFNIYIKSIKEEIEKNLSLPITVDSKKDYLNEILDYFQELDQSLIEDEDGKLSSTKHCFERKGQFTDDQDLLEDYPTFLVKSKETFREMIIWIYNKLESLVQSQIRNESPSHRQLFDWTKTDTDLLELLVALYEIGAVQNSAKDLSQKDIIKGFSSIFGKEIKYIHKKLNAARNRKKEDGSFIYRMQIALDEYYQRLDEKL